MQIHLFDSERDWRTVPAGQSIFEEGDAGDQMFAVIAGEVEIVIRGTLVETIGPGGVFGEMALIEDRPRIASAIARTETKLVPIDRKRFLFLVQQNPYFSLQLMTVMAQRLRAMDARL